LVRYVTLDGSLEGMPAELELSLAKLAANLVEGLLDDRSNNNGSGMERQEAA
jgi:hypothetical protein